MEPPSISVEDSTSFGKMRGGAGYNDTCDHYISEKEEELDLSVVLEQLATHIPDMVLYRSPQAPVPQITHCYGVIMFLDVSG